MAALDQQLLFHKSEMDLFTPAIVQGSYDQGFWTTYHPIAFEGNTAPLQFEINTENEYLDLSNTFLKVKAAVYDKRAGKNALAAGCEVGMGNNWLHTLFKSVKMSLNDTVITPSNNDYPYRAYMETLLSYGGDAKKSQLQAEGYYADTQGHFNERDAATNEGYGSRKALVAQSRGVDMIGRLHLDLFHQPQLLLNKVKVTLLLERSKDAFNLMGNRPDPAAADDHKKAEFTVRILEASLMVRKVLPSPAIALQHIQQLETTTAKYPIKRVVPKVFNINAGLKDHTQSDFITGQIPHRITIGLVSNEAYNGNLERNAFEFGHYNLNSLQVSVADKAATTTPMALDYANGNYMDGFFSLFSQTGQYGSDEGNSITREAYANGYTLYCFNLANDLNLEEDHFNGSKRGNVSIILKFANPLAETVTAVVLCEYENTIEIDRYRQVAIDFLG